MEYHSALKRKDVLTHTTTRMDLEDTERDKPVKK